MYMKTMQASLAVVIVLVFTASSFAAVIGSHLCDTDFVAGKIGDPGWVILDGRSAAEYEQGHIPGSVSYGKPVVNVLKHPVDGRVVSVPEAERLLAAIGLTNAKGLIVYGKKGDYHVAVEQLPLYVGVKEFYYLDGGYEAWTTEGKKTETHKNSPRPGSFKATLSRPDLYVSTDDMIKMVKNGAAGVTLIDTRSTAEYMALENTTLRGGRIPGAISIPVDQNIDPDSGKLLPLQSLAKLYKDIPKQNRIILYCHRGCRTAFAYYALQMLGYKNISIYEDSYIVWGARSDTPVEHEHYMNARPFVLGYDKLLKRIERLEKELAAVKKVAD